MAINENNLRFHLQMIRTGSLMVMYKGESRLLWPFFPALLLKKTCSHPDQLNSCF